MPRLLGWLDERQPDVVCLQETKLADDAFTTLLGEELSARGYETALYGEVQWNGVALLSKVGLEDVVKGVAGAPGFPDPEARAVAATCGGIRIHSLYVPNGRVPDSDHYRYKLEWLAALKEVVASGPAEAIVCGDMNIAPTDADVFDPAAYVGSTHVTAPERQALANLMSTGLHDVVRDRWPDERVFSYWDYRAGMFHQDLGMRIDLMLASDPVAERVKAAWIDRKARKGTGPSDHAPVIIDLDVAPDGDIGPVVPPPSAPRGGRKRTTKLPQNR
jgi:exodeoxyribonuclease-3